MLSAPVIHHVIAAAPMYVCVCVRMWHLAIRQMRNCVSSTVECSMHSNWFEMPKKDELKWIDVNSFIIFLHQFIRRCRLFSVDCIGNVVFFTEVRFDLHLALHIPRQGFELAMQNFCSFFSRPDYIFERGIIAVIYVTKCVRFDNHLVLWNDYLCVKICLSVWLISR